MGTIQDFYKSTRPNTVGALISLLRGNTPPQDRWDRGEPASWAASLPALADELHSAGLDSSWVALEYSPHQAGRRRADAVLMGAGRDGRPCYLVVELKQWAQASWDVAREQVTGTGAGYETPRHPFDQAFAYAQFIRNYTSGMHDEDQVTIAAAAFLHNATEGSIETLRTAGHDRSAGTFSGDSTGRRRFRERLHALLDPGRDGTAAKDRLMEAHYQQGPALLDAAARIFSDPDRYPLTDQQYEIFAHIQNAVSDAMSVSADRNQAVIVVKGGPGTGKTWIAMHLLGANAHAHRQVAYATNSGSLRSALQKSANFRSIFDGRPAHELITSARTYWDNARWHNPLDLLIVDEAQRLEEYTVRRAQNNPRELQERLEAQQITQIFELKKSAKVLVLFIDEDQAATYRDHVTIDEAERVAHRTGATFEIFELNEQHRSGGSEAYEAWVDALLGGTPTVWHDEDNFTVRVAESPQELERLTIDGDAGSARLLAGFCWEWSTPQFPVTIEDVPHDISIDGWHKRWNLRQPVDGFPRDTAWAHNPRGAEQVGSIFTAQGFEFDRCGVIIGPDLVWSAEAERMTVDMGASRYKKLVSLHRRDPAAADRVRNQYRVLLTRAMQGVVLYSTDPDTREMLESIVNPFEG
ncbi:DNA/RNA helicase domain-containing protein [Paractinoplanes hotanensis]|uniref:DNA/RNA helicase domain-containing protein n=1 Tax=Paractinoplanes hotanensis TaxID=2906497 RepID=UPI002042D4B4|nr:DNA/RNA helicase domain-containing protein [Actinoplanes hotanensis]